MILLVLVLAANFVFTWAIPIACVCACAWGRRRGWFLTFRSGRGNKYVHWSTVEQS